MNAQSRAALRDKVARARLSVAAEPPVLKEPAVTVAPPEVGVGANGETRPSTAGSLSTDSSMREWALLYDRGVFKLKSFANRCVYCGSRCHGRVCVYHRDLVQLEMEAC